MLNNYIFNVGDEVITIDGIRGTITYICDCELCRDRGFLEPEWRDDEGDDNYITDHEADRGFPSYYKIGNYRFNSFDRNLAANRVVMCMEHLSNLKKRLALIDELETKEK